MRINISDLFVQYSIIVFQPLAQHGHGSNDAPHSGVTHWRIDRRASDVQRKLTKSVYVSCALEERQAIVKRTLHKFEVRRNAKIYAW